MLFDDCRYPQVQITVRQCVERPVYTSTSTPSLHVLIYSFALHPELGEQYEGSKKQEEKTTETREKREVLGKKVGRK